MSIYSITMVGNEQEIIESFVRYNIHFFDKMVFVSSCCIDNTIFIINKLRDEGLPIELFIETDISFDQRYLDNKYMKKIASEGVADFILFLDCDEFISGRVNPRDFWNTLTLDRIYTIKWKYYAFTEKDDINEAFIPKRCEYAKRDFKGNSVGKVLIPSKMVFANNVCLQTGHHSVICENARNTDIADLWLAHFPTISKEQYLFRIYESSIKYITWRKRGFDEGYHVYNQILQIEEGEDIYKIANGYGMDDGEIAIEKDPLDLSFCKLSNLNMKYSEYSKIDLLKGIQHIGQLMAIKSYNLELDLEQDNEKKTVLIYGAGERAQRLMNGLPENLVNIRAYIDRNPIKKFRMFNRRLVIPPQFIYFFKYDMIIISSDKFYDEMLNTLLDLGVEKNKICSPSYLFDLI